MSFTAAVIDFSSRCCSCMWLPEFLAVDRARYSELRVVEHIRVLNGVGSSSRACVSKLGLTSGNGFGARWIGYGAVVAWSAAVEPELTVLGANDFGAYGWSIGNEV
ncbi:hypothetical protein PIB30_067755 [Stylosanthes scabra]|uniref:Uncharacterized protein n=1 Tax=Stylosanthes scabra TaxID=79078 RepID=A0ABU6RNH0_9FABA|nr:hypothetical protein [Stylosanthes scabra]